MFSSKIQRVSDVQRKIKVSKNISLNILVHSVYGAVAHSCQPGNKIFDRCTGLHVGSKTKTYKTSIRAFLLW